MPSVNVPFIRVTPDNALIDVRRRITLGGFTPYSIVQLNASTRWSDGSVWTSTNSYFTGAKGRVDLDNTCPLYGSYACVDAMGPVWSMVCDQADTAAHPPLDTQPIVIKLTASLEGQPPVASATLTQTFLAEGVEKHSINQDGVVGDLYLPAGDGPHPAIIYMNGSSGGIDSPRAALFAAHGYICLALGLFGVPGRPRYLNDMPLEYCKNAMDWLRRTQKPDNDFVAVSGISRGGEFSLLMAAHYPDDVSAVIPFVPSVLAHGTVSAGVPELGRNAAAWSLRGQPLPHLWEDNPHADWGVSFSMPPPIRQTYAFTAAMKRPELFSRACIPVENITAPTLLISACDDGFWPSTPYCNIVEEKIRAAGVNDFVRHAAFDGAGHHILYPYLPTTLISKPHAVSKVELSGGGDARSNAKANLGAYVQALQFLHDARAHHNSHGKRPSPAHGKVDSVTL